MKYILLSVLFFVFNNSCVFTNSSDHKNERPLLSKSKKEYTCMLNHPESVFPYMLNIDSMQNVRTKSFELYKVHIGNTKSYNKIIKANASNLILEHDGHISNYNIAIKNDSLILESNSVIHSMAIFKDRYDFLLKTQNTVDTLKREYFNFLDYTAALESVFYDKFCKDSVYKFKYDYSPISGVPEDMLREKVYKNILISKKRGIIKLVLQDRKTGDLWEAKYFGNSQN